MKTIELPVPSNQTEQLQEIDNHVLDACIARAKELGIAQSPEAMFALSYLLASRTMLSPLIKNINNNSWLLQTTGGPEYNPHTKIDNFAGKIAHTLATKFNNLPNVAMRIEEEHAFCSLAENTHEPPTLFAIIDPIDDTDGIAQGTNTQTSGIAIYDTNGTLKTLGMIHLVNTSFLFIETTETGTQNNYSIAYHINKHESADTQQIRIGTIARRMNLLHHLPLFANLEKPHVDCVSGHAVFALMENSVDTLTDPIKGQPWYEALIWAQAAKLLGYPVTDRYGNTINFQKIAQEVIQQNPTDAYRIPLVMSRNLEIHQKVLSKLR